MQLVGQARVLLLGLRSAHVFAQLRFDRFPLLFSPRQLLLSDASLLQRLIAVALELQHAALQSGLL